MREWINGVYTDKYTSQTTTNFAGASIRNGKEELLDAFKRAYEGGVYRPQLINSESVDRIFEGQSEYINWKLCNDVPKRVKNRGNGKIYFVVISWFSIEPELWSSSQFS